MRNLTIGALRGLQDVEQPLWVSVFLLWGLAIPSGYVLAFQFKQGTLGINMVFLVVFILGAIFMLLRFNSKTI